MRLPRRFPAPALLAAVLALLPAGAPAARDAAAQTAPQTAAAQAPVRGRLILVLPFENRSGQSSLDWIDEAFPAILNARFASAGMLPIRRDDRMYALDHLGLPTDFRPSRASTIRLAQTLGAEYVVLGSFTTSANRITASAQLLNVPDLRLGSPITAQTDLPRLLDVLNSLAWQLVRTLDPGFGVEEQTFLASTRDLRLDAFEHYVRGLTAPLPEDRVHMLAEAVRLSPAFAPATLALGKAYFADQEYEKAAATLGKLSRDDPSALEAQFYRGLAFFYTGSYVRAEDAFAYIAQFLPLPEVVNNQGVAASRHGGDGTALFRQAVSLDPNDPDYRFNLAVSLYRHHESDAAQKEIAEVLRLRPGDTEARAFAAAMHAPRRPEPAPEAGSAQAEDSAGGSLIPLERIRRGYDESSFRQAAAALDQMEEVHLAALPPREQARRLRDQGMQYLNRGLILEAERKLLAAIHADSTDALAYAGLAEVRERSGNLEDARAQAQKSLAQAPNALAYVVLARLDLNGNRIGPAAEEVSQALRLEPANAAARSLEQKIQARGQPKAP
jgi:tetratricopeptide (TPR) repeat protein/TolB-like protein